MIAAELYGPHGGLVFRNLNGSFYDFMAERLRGTQRETLVAPPDAWGGRAIVAFAKSLRRDVRHDEESAR